VTPYVIVVEDEDALATLLDYNLMKEGFRVERAADGEEALLRVAEEPPDLVVLDWMLPKVSGVEVCRQLRAGAETRRTPVLMLTARGEEADKVRGLDTGADDYVVKPFAMSELVARIRALLRRTQPQAATARELDSGGLKIDTGSRRATLDGEPLDLSRKEFDLLVELVSHAGEVVTREDLMAAVWDRNWFGSTKTLDVHIGWLRKKLGDDSSDPRYLHTVRGVGFRFATTEELASAG